MSMHMTKLASAALAISLVISACGSSDSDTNGNGDAPVQPATPIESPASAAPPLDERGVSVDDIQFVVRESFPMQIAVDISGTQPTPCHQLNWSFTPGGTTSESGADVAAEGSVHEISIWASDPAPDVSCIQAIEPFNLLVEVGDFVFGEYTIVVNGVDYPLSL